MCMILHREVHRAVTTALYLYGYIMNILCINNNLIIIYYTICYIMILHICERPIKFDGSLVKSYFGRTLCPANFFSLFRALQLMQHCMVGVVWRCVYSLLVYVGSYGLLA